MKEVYTKTYQVDDFTKNLFDQFTSYIDCSEKTVETYSISLRQFSKYMSDHEIKNPTRQDVISFRDSLKADHKPTTIQNYIIAIRQFFRWTAQEGIYPNIADHIKGAKLDKDHKKDYLTPSQVKRVLELTSGQDELSKRDYAVLALMITCGLRTIEVSRANIEDLRTLGDSTVLYIQGKGHDEKADYVKIAPEVENAIRSYLSMRGHVSEAEPLFTSTSNNNKGQRISTHTVSSIAKKAFLRAGLNSSRLTAHSTRHTAVTLALLAGEKIEAVQQFARHKSIETTLIYSHALDKAQNSCSSTIARVIF